MPHVVAYWGFITLGSLSLLLPGWAQATAPRLGSARNPPFLESFHNCVQAYTTV